MPPNGTVVTSLLLMLASPVRCTQSGSRGDDSQRKRQPSWEPSGPGRRNESLTGEIPPAKPKESRQLRGIDAAAAWARQSYTLGNGPLGGDVLAGPGMSMGVPWLTHSAGKHHMRTCAFHEANAVEKIQERKNMFSGTVEKSKNANFHFGALDPTTMWYSFGPYYSCDWTLDKYPSFANEFDGGKWVCGLRELGLSQRTPDQQCVVYSFGSCNNDHFEKRVHALTNGRCRVHIFDPHSKPIRGPHVTQYHSVGLTGESDVPPKAKSRLIKWGDRVIGNGATLKEIMTTLEHKSVDVLKVDIEGSEFNAFYDLDWSNLPAKIGQLLVEVHPKRIADFEPPQAKGDGGGHPVLKWDRLQRNLEKHGYRLFSMEPVASSDTSQVELGFIHRDWTPDGWVSPETRKETGGLQHKHHEHEHEHQELQHHDEKSLVGDHHNILNTNAVDSSVGSRQLFKEQEPRWSKTARKQLTELCSHRSFFGAAFFRYFFNIVELCGEVEAFETAEKN
jgi:hypothetical protein